MDTRPFAEVVYFKLKMALEELKMNGFCKCVDGVKCMLCYKLEVAIKSYDATK